MTYLFPFKIDIVNIFKFAEINFRGLWGKYISLDT
jgi:hypothetical protein